MNDSSTLTSTRFPVRRTLAIVGIIVLTVFLSALLLKSGPQAEKRPPAPMQANVKVQALVKSDTQVLVDAMGIVIPQRSIELNSQVSGEVLELGSNFVEGHYLHKGEFILQTDKRDYQTALKKAEATLALSQSALAIESGNQSIAQREWGLIQEASEIAGVNASLALREPQLKSAEAEVQMALASLEEAQLDLERTRVVAPFHSIVQEKSVDVGSYLTPQSSLGSLVGTDVYWVRVAVPKSQLFWLTLPGAGQSEGSQARVFPSADGEAYRDGVVVALLGDLDPEGRMARVLVAVEDPLSLQAENAHKPPLLLGDYVRVELVGHRLTDVFSLPRESLHDGSRVWLANEDNKLEVREITPVWQSDDLAIVEDGLEEGERLITSNLSMATPGLQLVIAEEKIENVSQTNPIAPAPIK